MEATDVSQQLAAGVRRLLAAQTPTWSQGELARRLKWSPGNVSRMLSGRWAPSAATLAQLCDVFSVSLCELLCEAKAKPKKK